MTMLFFLYSGAEGGPASEGLLAGVAVWRKGRGRVHHRGLPQPAVAPTRPKHAVTKLDLIYLAARTILQRNL